jgi:hypothetical protein
MGLFSTFLVWASTASRKKKSPASRRDLPVLAYFVSELATALALLIGPLALTVRVLLPVRVLLLSRRLL